MKSFSEILMLAIYLLYLFITEVLTNICYIHNFVTTIQNTKGVKIAHPPALIFSLLFWSTIEFEVLASNRLLANGVRSEVLGWSGTASKYLSSLSLKSSIEHLERFHTVFGRELNRAGPFTFKLFSLNVFTF